MSYMPNFELRIIPLHAIINAHDLLEPISDKFSSEAKAAFDGIRNALLIWLWLHCDATRR